MSESGTTTATRGQRAHPLSVQERMALKGWFAPFCSPVDEDDGAEGEDAPVVARVGGAVLEVSEVEPSRSPVEASTVDVLGIPAATSGVTEVPAGWHDRPIERRVERRRAERRSLGDAIGADAELFSLVVSRRDMALGGCCTAVGLLAGYVFF